MLKNLLNCQISSLTYIKIINDLLNVNIIQSYLRLLF